MLLTFLKTNTEQSASAKIVKFADRIWLPEWNPYLGRLNHWLYPEILLLRNLAIENSADSSTSISRLLMILPLREKSILGIDDHGERLLDSNDPFMKVAAFGTSIIREERRIDWDGMERVRVLSGVNFEKQSFGDYTLLTIFFNSEIPPGEIGALRILFRIAAVDIIERKKRGIAVSLNYFELPHPLPDSLTIIRDQEIPCRAWYGDYSSDQSYAKGGGDIFV